MLHAPKRNDRVRVLISFPRAVLAEVDKAAKRNWRSRTSEVVVRVESTFWDEHGRMLPQRAPVATEKKRGAQA
jgi:metal-responsive CopG/Arc/MetJ family transcriptional regulator